jgi:hypothetical protein
MIASALSLLVAAGSDLNITLGIQMACLSELIYLAIVFMDLGFLVHLMSNSLEPVLDTLKHTKFL